ncbi:hypothetical protein AMK59_337 [Oryctes borbonicus]|uniref:Ig-like domain-containing protein n=1 Tax=Oryctes borbonicus TaxID=1629725 RepID=A0A0T6BBU9_9SCAR|nr:hypothetical protein AMK59_337 [Oryctes borbonicus]
MISIFFSAFGAIKINELIVPDQLQNGQADYVVLDCKYEIENKDDSVGLVVKWYFGQDLVYQWFPETEKRSTLWKKRVDLNYNVSDDRLTKYRALKIANVTTDITGEYTCQVSSMYAEASRAKTMVIYEPPSMFTFEHFENESTLSCAAYETFPRPVMKIYTVKWADFAPGRDLQYDEYSALLLDTGEEGGIDDVEKAHGSYNVTASYEYDPSVITEPVEFVCELTIPNTNFTKRSSTIIAPEGETTSTTSQYDFETTTMTTTTIQSIVPAENCC